MVLKKIAAAMLATVIAASSISAASFAAGTSAWTDTQGNKWKNDFTISEEESSLKITVENTVVDGKEVSAVKLSGVPAKAADKNVRYNAPEESEYDDFVHVSSFSSQITAATIDVGECFLCFLPKFADIDDANYKNGTATEGMSVKVGIEELYCAVITPAQPREEYHYDEDGAVDFREGYYDNIYATEVTLYNSLGLDPYADEYSKDFYSTNLKAENPPYTDAEVKKSGDSYDFIAYFDKEDDIIKTLLSAENANVLMYGMVDGSEYAYDSNGDMAGGMGMGGYFKINSDGKILVPSCEAELYEMNLAEKVVVNEWEDAYECRLDFSKDKVSVTEVVAPPVSDEEDPKEDDVTEEEAAVIEGITLEEGDEEAFEEEVTMKVTGGYTNESTRFTVDISFVNQLLQSVQPKSEVTVKIPVPPAFSEVAESLKVYHEKDGKYEDMNAKVINGEIVFKTSHFSTYIVTTEELDASPAVTPGDTDPADGSGSGSNTGSDQKPTGIALAIAPVVLAAGAAIVLSKKRK